MFPIYLDNAATTKLDKSLIEVYQSFSCDEFFNPSAGYTQAIKNHKYLDDARDSLLKKLGARTGKIIFTSGATESSNLAINGSVREGKWEYVTTMGEHPSVYNVFKKLEEKGFKVHYVNLDKNGQVDYNDLEKKINENTRLVSVMFVSNESGAINDLHKICQIVKGKNPKALLHVDAVQGFCKIPLSLSGLDVDLLSVSGHKFYAPKGVGALYVKNINALKPIVFGGGQEDGFRSGTENLPAIMCMGKMCEKIDVSSNLRAVEELQKVFLGQIPRDVVGVIETQSPYILSLSFPNVNGETLMRALEKEVIVGTGSACSSKKSGNRVLENMGFDKDYIKSCIRVSFNPYLTQEEVKVAGQKIMQKYFEILEKVR